MSLISQQFIHLLWSFGNNFRLSTSFRVLIDKESYGLSAVVGVMIDYYLDLEVMIFQPAVLDLVMQSL